MNSGPTSNGDNSGETALVSKRKKGLILMAFTVAVSLLLGEALLRLVWHNPYNHEDPDLLLKIPIQHPRIDFKINRAAIDPVHPQVRLRTNDRSYVLPSSQFPDPQASVAFMGGSTTLCSAVKEDLRFPALVSELLAKRSLKINTLNAGRAGNTLQDSLTNLIYHVIDDRPDVVVLLQATNDIGVLSRDGDYRSRGGRVVGFASMAKWCLQIFSSHSHLAALVRYVATSSPVQAVDPSRVDGRNSADEDFPIEPYRQRLKAFIHLSRDFGIEPVLMTQPLSSSTNAMTPDWTNLGKQDRFNALIRQTAGEENVLLIDLVAHLMESEPDWNAPMTIFYDGMHITDRGSQTYAAHIAERLAPMLTALVAEKKSRVPLE